MSKAFEKLWVPDKNPMWILRGFDRYRAPLPMRRSLEVLPGVQSFDDRSINFLRQMTKKLNEHKMLQPNLNANHMVSENGIHTSFNRVKTVAGYSSTPLSWTPVNNHLLCESMGIPNDFRNERHRLIFDEYFGLIFGNWKPTSVKVPKKSTCGIPMMHVYDADYKREVALHLYDNIEVIIDLFSKGDFTKLAEDFGIVFCFNVNRRGQVDEPGKKRFSNSKEYALSGGAKGAIIPVDKTVVMKDGTTHDDFSATRERIVHGASWLINCILQIISSGHMYAMFEMFPKTFHHTDPQDIADECATSGDATFSDVDSYDTTMREWLIRRVFAKAREYWQPELIDMAETLMFAPYYSRPLERKVEDGAAQRGSFIGNPFDPQNTQVIAGNRSGHAWTSFMAKSVKQYESLCVADDTFNDVLGNVKKYLEHKAVLKFANNGDDEGAMGSKIAVDAYRKNRYDNKHGYFKVSEEIGQGFSGTLMRWSNGKGQAIPRLHTTFEKFYCPERSIGGVFRPRWPIGFITRMDSFSKHPSGHYAEEIHRQCWYDHMKPHFGSFGELLIGAMEQLDVDYEGTTAIEREVLDDEEKIHYKYSEHDVSDAVMDKIVTRIKPEHFQWAFAKYSGNLL